VIDADTSVISSVILFSLLTDIDLEGSCSNGTKTRHVNLSVF
jgi:hypothetical protein